MAEDYLKMGMARVEKIELPEPYLLAAERLGVVPERCVVFEDSAAGGLAARGAGAAAIAVGDQDWTVEPAARIPDLRHVAVEPAADRSIVLAID